MMPHLPLPPHPKGVCVVCVCGGVGGGIVHWPSCEFSLQKSGSFPEESQLPLGHATHWVMLPSLNDLWMLLEFSWQNLSSEHFMASAG